VYVTQKSRSFRRASAASSSASATSSVSGLSQATWMPRERNALARRSASHWGDDHAKSIPSRRALRLGHLLEGSIEAGRVEPEGAAGAERVLVIPEKQPATSVAEPSSAIAAVDVADEGTLTPPPCRTQGSAIAAPLSALPALEGAYRAACGRATRWPAVIGLSQMQVRDARAERVAMARVEAAGHVAVTWPLPSEKVRSKLPRRRSRQSG